MRHIAFSTPIRNATVIDTRRDASVRTRLLASTSRRALSMSSALLVSTVLGVTLSGEARAQSVVNPVQTTTYTLATGTTIFGGGTNINVSVGDAIFGDLAQSPFDVVLQSGAIVTATAGTGVSLQAGSLLIESGATIVGAGAGVFFSEAASAMTNAGSITADDGIILNNGGNVTNLAGGTISGTSIGILLLDEAVVTNAGTITGGVISSSGGSVVNEASGTIADGVFFSDRSSVTNAGSITNSGAGGIGVELGDGGSVTNLAGGTISGSVFGIDIDGDAGTVTNAGSINGSIGIRLQAGGSVTNEAGGTISGGVGIEIYGGAGTVTNAGVITGTVDGVFLRSGGSVSNLAGGSITGDSNDGIEISGGAGTVINAGDITAASSSVRLFNGGSVTNQAGGTISGGVFGINISGGAGTVINAGSITGGTSGAGIFLQGGGGVTNQADGTISGALRGVSILNSAGTVTNAGTIAAASFGIDLQAGGSVANQAGGTISGGLYGVRGADTVTNAGDIKGTVLMGVYLRSGGSVTNQAGGVISGGAYGVFVRGGAGTVTNAGTITRTNGDAVRFDGTGDNTLILQTGSVLNGNAVGSTAGGATNALLLQGTGRADNAFLNFNTLDVQASGLWALNGVSAFGATTIDSGTLVVGGAGHSGAQLTGGITVNAGGALAGAGAVIGDVSVLSGGAIAPGAAGSISTLNVSGNASFSAGSFYRVNIDGAESDRLVLSGTAALGGATLQTVYVGGVQRSYNLLHADGGLGGSSFTAVTSNWGGFSQSLSYTPTDVILTLTAQLGAGADLSGNQRNVADSINHFFNAGGNLPAGFGRLFALDGAPLGTALSQISGEAAAGAQQGAVQMMTDFLGLMSDPTADGRGGFGAGGGALGFAPERAAVPGDVRLAYAAALKAPPLSAPPVDQRWNVWGSAFGGGSRIDGDAAVGSSNVSAKTYGVAVGADYRVAPDTRIGFAVSGGGTNWNLAQGLGGGTSHAFQAGLYGKTYFGPAYVSASLAAANHWMSTSRVAFGGDHLTADFNAQSFGGRIEGGYRFATAFAGITPYAAAQAQLFRTPGYSETDVSGGGFGLSYAARDATAVRSELGGRFDRDFALTNADAVMTLRGRLAWAHDWVSDPRLSATFQGLPGASFVVTGATPAADLALASVGSELRWRSGWSLAVKLDGEFASQAQTYTGTGTVRYRW